MTIHNGNPHTILLVDDDRLILSTSAEGLTIAGYKVSTVESVDEAEKWLDENERPDLVVLDMYMPNRDGIELSPRLEAMNHIPFILLTAYSEEEIVSKAKALGAMSYLVKPAHIRQLIPAIETAISRAKEAQALRIAKKNLEIALDGDRAISMAVGIIMDQQNLDHNEAFETMRKNARSNHLKLADFANAIVKARETLNMTFHTKQQTSL